MCVGCLLMRGGFVACLGFRGCVDCVMAIPCCLAGGMVGCAVCGLG